MLHSILLLTCVPRVYLWIPKEVARYSPASHKAVRKEVDKLLVNGAFLPAGSVVGPARKAFKQFQTHPRDPESLLRMTLLFTYGKYDVTFRTSKEYRTYQSTLDIVWGDLRNPWTSYDMVRAGMLYYLDIQIEAFCNTDSVENYATVESDPILLAVQLVEDCYFERDDPKLVGAPSIVSKLGKVPYLRFRTQSAINIYASRLAVEAKSRQRTLQVVKDLRTLASWIPEGHPDFVRKQYFETAAGLEKLAKSWK